MLYNMIKLLNINYYHLIITGILKFLTQKDILMYTWYTLYAIGMIGLAISYYIKVHILGYKL